MRKQASKPSTRGSRVIERPARTPEQVMESIRYLAHDDELHPSTSHALQTESAVLSNTQVGQLIKEFMAERRQMPEPSNPRLRSVQSNLDYCIRFLKDLAIKKTSLGQSTSRQGNVDYSRRSGIETCTCGAHHPYGANYYVSVQDSGREMLLAGPFKTHAEAMAAVKRTTEVAHQRDPRSHFYAFGTVAMRHSYTKPGILNSHL